MYRCCLCQRVQPAGTPSVLTVLQTRAVVYPRREQALPPLPAKKGQRKARKERPERRDDPGGVGFETVREQRCCPACAAVLRAAQEPSSEAAERSPVLVQR